MRSRKKRLVNVVERVKYERVVSIKAVDIEKDPFAGLFGPD